MTRRTAETANVPIAPSIPPAPPVKTPRLSRRVYAWTIVICVLVTTVLTWRPAVSAYVSWRAESFLRTREAGRALEVLEPALRLQPTSAEFHFLSARAERQLGHMEEAREHLQRAWKLGYPVEPLKREQWLAMAQSGQLREAGPHLADLLMSAGEDGWEVCEAYAAGYIMACQFGAAQKLLDAWKRDFPEDAQPYYFEGRWLESASATTDAVEAYREAMKRDPARVDIRQHLAGCLVELHEYGDATALLQELLTESPDDPDILNDWATCLLEQGDSAGAGSAAEQALALDADHVAARLTLARIASFDGEYETAVGILEPLASERPYDVEVRYAYALALQADGRTEESAAEFEFAARGRESLSKVRGWMDEIKQKPEDVELRYQIGITLQQYDSPEDGAAWLRSALDVQPRHRPSLVALIAYHQSQGHVDLAESYRQQLMALENPAVP